MRVLNFNWRRLVNMMKSGGWPSNLESAVARGTMPRRRPLHTCGASCLAIAHKAFTKVQDLDGPLGSMPKRAIAFFNSFFPFVYSLLYQWLALLSIMDDHILTVESKIETIFPQSTCLFDKIDGLVCSAQVLPEQLDDVFRKFSLMMHQFPLLDWVLVHLISWLNIILSILTHWGSKNTREKEITIDVNCNDIHSCRTESEERAAYCPVKSLAKDQSASSEDKANAARNHTEPSKSVHFEELEKSSYSSHENTNAERNHTIPSNSVHFEEHEKSYSSQENTNAARNHTQPSNSVHENTNAAWNHIEPSKAVPSEVIHLSVKRLHSWKSRIKALEEPLYASDSPMYSSYQSANSSPMSDCSQDETYPCSQIGKADTMNCTYKEMLERGTKEDDEREEDNALHEFPKAFVDEEKDEIAEKMGTIANKDHKEKVLEGN